VLQARAELLAQGHEEIGGGQRLFLIIDLSPNFRRQKSRPGDPGPPLLNIQYIVPE
jgi:hypothetical protein